MGRRGQISAWDVEDRSVSNLMMSCSHKPVCGQHLLKRIEKKGYDAFSSWFSAIKSYILYIFSTKKGEKKGYAGVAKVFLL
jgi:hypothetical protein